MQQEWKSAYMKAQLDVMSVQRKVKKVCSVLSSSDKAMCQRLYKVGDIVSTPPTLVGGGLKVFPRLPCRWGLGICKNLGGGWA